jgi:Uma2 family endonuclease
MVVQTRRYTVEEFDQWIALPENADKLFEYIGGGMVEVVSNNYASVAANKVSFYIQLYLVQQKMGGYVTGADGGYQVAGERYMPDVGFISKTRQPEPCHEAYNPNAPDLAVEALSPNDNPREVWIKVINYLAAGTIVWVVDPELKQVEICESGQPVKRVGFDETLDAGDVLPGFTLVIKDIFPD